MSQESINYKRPNRREKKGAKELLRLGLKVYDYRKDRLSPVATRGLNQANNALKVALKDRQVTSELLESKARLLDEALRKSGGHYYHKKTG